MMDLDKPFNPCFVCLMESTYSDTKLVDASFVIERKEEFYPHSEFGDKFGVCKEHYDLANMVDGVCYGIFLCENQEGK